MSELDDAWEQANGHRELAEKANARAAELEEELDDVRLALWRLRDHHSQSSHEECPHASEREGSIRETLMKRHRVLMRRVDRALEGYEPGYVTAMMQPLRDIQKATEHFNALLEAAQGLLK